MHVQVPHPQLQGLFTHKYPENGFGHIQPRGEIRDSIVPPDFRWLPELVTEALQTLSRRDATPTPSPNPSTDTEVTTHVHRLCVQAQSPWDALRRTVLDIMAEVGHILPELEDYDTGEGSEVNDIDTPPMLPMRRVIIEVAQRMQPEPQGLTAEELLNPSWHHATASPTKQSPTPHSSVPPMSGRQMDASHNMRAQAKRT